MSYDLMFTHNSMRDKVIISILKKRIHRSWLISLIRYPVAHRPKRWEHIRRNPEKKFAATFHGPHRKLIISSFDFVADFLNAEYFLFNICGDKPVPECGAKIKPIISVLRLYKYVSIE